MKIELDKLQESIGLIGAALMSINNQAKEMKARYKSINKPKIHGVFPYGNTGIIASY